MHSTLNLATRRLLQVVLDMLSNPNHAMLMAEREAAKKAGERVYDPPSPYRNELIAIEAAYRAAKEAQQMLAEAHEPDLPLMPAPTFPGFPGIPPVTCEPKNTGRQFNDTKITCGGGAQ